MNINFKNISKNYDTPAWPIHILDDVDVQINTWEFIAIMWASWTGKTTILNLISWLVTPNTGSIYIWDTDISSLTWDQMTIYRGAHMWFVFQQFNLLPDLTVAENIDLVIDINKLKRRRKTLDILDKVGLTWRQDAYPSQLSGGEQQRVAVARAFVWDTPILLADEPTGNLDQKTATQIMELMKSLHAETNNTIVMITHDLDIGNYADRIYTLSEQKLR